MNLYFVTKEETAKHHNLQENPQAAIALYDESTQSTLQVVGTVQVVREMEKFKTLFDKILDANQEATGAERPPVSKLFAGDYFMYCLSPSSMRLAEFTKPDQGNYGELFSVVK